MYTRHPHKLRVGAKRLHACRVAAHLNQPAMADRLGLMPATYVSYEHGRTRKVPTRVMTAARAIAAGTPPPPAPSAAALVCGWAERLGTDATHHKELARALAVPPGLVRVWLSGNGTRVAAEERIAIERRVTSEEKWLRGFVARHPDVGTTAPGLIPDKFLYREPANGRARKGRGHARA